MNSNQIEAFSVGMKVSKENNRRVNIFHIIKTINY